MEYVISRGTSYIKPEMCVSVLMSDSLVNSRAESKQPSLYLSMGSVKLENAPNPNKKPKNIEPKAITAYDIPQMRQQDFKTRTGCMNKLEMS